MKKLIFCALFASCAPLKNTNDAPAKFTVPAVHDAQPVACAAPNFQHAVHQHVAYLSKKHPHGHAVAIGYIYGHANVARETSRACGLPASLILAVALLESGRGTSSIAVCAANHFGIKEGDGWRGAVHTCGRGKQWRKYPSVNASYADFGAFVAFHAPNVIKHPTVRNFALSGYAGGGKRAARYAIALESIITRYELRDLFDEN